MKKRLIVDMDGVISDLYRQLANLEKRDSGKETDISDLWGLTEIEAFPNCKKHVHEDGFFRTSCVIDGSQEAMRYLNDKYELFIVSAGMEFPKSLREKYDWLGEYFPFIPWQHIVFCGSKKMIMGDIMIDDYAHNLDSFSGKKILFTQPHNKYLENSDFVRVSSWEEILDIL